jgi:hypothetical protein
MAEAIGLDHLVGDEKQEFEANMWRNLQVPARLVTMAAALAICATDRTTDWLHTDEREVRGRLVVEITKPRTLPRPRNEIEAQIIGATFGKDHPSAKKTGRIIRGIAADELYAWIESQQLAPDDPARIWFSGGYRPELTRDVDQYLSVLPAWMSSDIVYGRSVTNSSLTGRPQVGGYFEMNARAEDALLRRGEREHKYYFGKQSEGGASRAEDRRIVLGTVPKILWAHRHQHHALAHNELAVAALVASAVEAATHQ